MTYIEKVIASIGDSYVVSNVGEQQEFFADLSGGQVSFEVEPSLAKLNFNSSYLYSNAIGSNGLIDEYKKILSKLTNNSNKNDVLITLGAKQGLFLALHLFSSNNSKVMIPSFGWPVYRYICNYLELQIIHYNVFTLTKDLEELIELNKPQILILNTPHNPTGHYYSTEELRKIARICEKNGIKIISDEVYNFHYRYSNTMLCCNENSPSNTVVVDSVSKWGPYSGLRIGFFNSSQENVNKVKYLIALSNSCPPGTSEHACLHILNSFDRLNEFVTSEVARRQKIVANYLDSIGANNYMQGGIYTWLPDVTGNQVLGIKGIPGTDFGSDMGLRLCSTGDLSSLEKKGST